MPKILVIDDDEAMRRMIRRILTEAGHEVVEAPDGRVGMRQFRAEAPDVVVTDILMPEQEGIRTILDIRQSGVATRIIAISGGSAAGRDYLYLAEGLGADAVLPKPFRAAELTALIDEVLARPTAAAKP